MIIDTISGIKKFKAISIIILYNTIIIIIFNYFFVMKIIIAFSCKDSSMLVSSIIEVERNYNSSLNVIMSIGPIPCFHSGTRMLYI